MPTETFDAIVIGAGAAGLCCVAELVIQGKRPLLISETKEVAHAFRSVFVGESRGTVQALAWQTGYNGGWWAPLIRELGLSLKFRHYPPVESSVIGSGEFTSIPLVGSAAALAEVLSAAAPAPLSDSTVEGITTSVGAALDMSWEETFSLDRVRLHDWLADHGADLEGAAMVTAFLGRTFALMPEESVEHLSVSSGVGVLRVMFSGDGFLCEVFPDSRDGVWIPMAKEIERRGAEIWRGRKVKRVVVEDGRAVGVRLQDDTEVRAPAVAIATSNDRMATFFAELPAELREAIAYPAPRPPRQVAFYILVDHPVMARPAAIALNDEDGRTLTYAIAEHDSNVEPGKQLLKVSLNNAGDRTTDEMLDECHEILSRAFPDYEGSVLDVGTITYTPSHWMDYTTIGPKLPRKSSSTDGLWFVGEGATPIVGVWAEAAAGSGVLGARAIAAEV